MEEKCVGCAYFRFCSLNEEYLRRKFKNCQEIKNYIDNKLPENLKRIFQSFVNYTYYSPLLKGNFVKTDLRDAEAGYPLILDVEQVDYSNVQDFIKIRSIPSWIIGYLSKNPDAVLDKLILFSQIFSRNNSLLYVPFSVIKNNIERSFFILNQLKIDIFIYFDSDISSDFLNLGEKWLRAGMTRIYPFDSYFCSFFSRVFSLPYFYSGSFVNGIVHDAYKERVNLKSEFLSFCANIIDLESIQAQIKQSLPLLVKNYNVEELELSPFLMDESIISNYSFEYLSYVYLNDIVEGRINKSLGGNIILSFDEADPVNLMKSSEKIDRVKSVLLPAYEIFIEVREDKKRQYFTEENISGILNLLKGFDISWYVRCLPDKNSLKNIFEIYGRTGGDIFIVSEDSSFYRDLIDIVFSGPFGFVPEPVKTAFILWLEGVSKCHFLNSMFERSIIEDVFKYIHKKVVLLMEG